MLAPQTELHHVIFVAGVVARLVRWDMRAKGGAVQDSPVVEYKEGKDYASKVNFNCMATSGGALTPKNPSTPCPLTASDDATTQCNSKSIKMPKSAEGVRRSRSKRAMAYTHLRRTPERKMCCLQKIAGPHCS